METSKLAGLPAKGDIKRRPKSTKRKKPNEPTAGGPVAPSLARVDGLTATSGAKSDSGIKLETSSGGGDDSGINMADTWQRNGHSADFVRHGLDGMPPNAMMATGPGSAPPPSSQDTFGPPSNQPGGAGSSSLPPGAKQPLGNCVPSLQQQQQLPLQGFGGQPPPGSRGGGNGGLMPPNGGMLPMMDGGGGGGMPNFMPQQSQVFVFSTEMANRAADAVERGLCRTIVDYHLDQPVTRQFMQNLSAGGPPHPSQHYMGPPFGPPDGPPHMGDPSLGPPPQGDVGPGGGGDMGGGSALANVELWVQQQNATLQEGPFSPSFGPTSQPMPPGGHRSRSNGDGSNGLGPPRCCPGPHHPGGAEFGPGPSGADPMFAPQPPPGYAHEHQHMMRGITGARVPDENLTPEQLQRREEQLAHLQKIKQMLFPEKQGASFEGGPGPQRYPGGPPPPGMYGRPGQPDDMPPHHHMMGQPPQRFMHHGGPPPPGMMVPGAVGMMDQPGPPDGVMMMGGMGPGGPFGEPAGLPHNWDVMSAEEREWFRLQQEYYLEQRQKRQMQLQQMGGGGPPPPGYFGDMPRQPPGRGSGPLSPVSPSFNGPSPHDPQGFFFQGQPPPGMNFPTGRPNFPPNGPGGGPPNFNPEFVPHPDGGFPPYGNPMMMQDPGSFPGGRFPPVCAKPKRKRGGNAAACMPGAVDRPGDDIFRHLQPAPSPQQFCSLNLFDGQELTITKQLNLAYQEPTSSSPSQQQHQHQQPCTTPPVTTAPSRKKKKSNNELRIKAENIDSGGGNGGGSSGVGGGCPLSPVGQVGPEAGDSMSDRPGTSPSMSASMRPAAGSGPITSATLASLARGVESLSDRIQADMLRGGPFGAVQMPEPDEGGDADDRRSNAGGSMPDPLRNPRCPTSDVQLQGPPDITGGPVDRSPTSACGSVKQDPSSMLSPQASMADSNSGTMVQQSNRYTTGTSCPSSVQSPGGMVGNASVQIEPRAPNTIQYLPARPPTSSELEMAAMERSGMPADGNEMFRQMGPGGPYCPNGAPMLPPGYDGPLPPGYNGPLGRFDGPGYGGGPPLSPVSMPPIRGGQMPGEMMFTDGGPGGPMPFPDGPMMHPGPGSMPYHGGRPMFYRSGPMPPQGGPMYRPGQNPQMMMHAEFRDGPPDRMMAMGGGMRPNPNGGGPMMMMGSGRPVLPPDQPPIVTNPAPPRSRTESRSKKAKDAKRRAEAAAAAAAAARQNQPVCEDPTMIMAGRPDQRGMMQPQFAGGPGGQMSGGPPMGFVPGSGGDGSGMMMMDRMRPGPIMRNEQAMMMMMAGKGGMRPGDGSDLMPPGHQMMMSMGPRGDPEMRPDPVMMGPGGDMRPGSGMMGGPPPGMMGPNEIRQGPGGMMDMRPGSGMMMGPGDGRPGSGMMGPGEMRPGSAIMLQQGDGRPGSGMLLSNEMNQVPGSMGSCDPRPGSGMIVMSPRDDGGNAEGSRVRHGNNNNKGSSGVPPNSEGSRPESVGRRSDVEMMSGIGPGGMMSGHRPGSKMMMQSSSDGEMRPGSVAGMDMGMDGGGMRPGSAIMMGMGPGDGRMRPGPDMMGMGPVDGGMRPGSALMMGMGPGDMWSRQDMIMGMDPMEMGMRPGSEMMMQMGPGDGSMRPGGGPVMMGMNPGDSGMRPGPDMMMGVNSSEVRLRPGSAAMMMGMVPGFDGQMMGMGPSDGQMGEGMGMMGLNPPDFDPRGCPPEMMNAHRMGPMGPRMMSPNDPGMRYDGAGPMVPMRMNRPRGELDFRMMGGMDPGMRSGPYGPGMRNGGNCPPADRHMMMMMMNAGPNSSGGPMQPGDFGPGMGPPMSGMGPADGSQFQQFQQQLYATKGHHPQQQGPPSPTMMMMMDARGGNGGNFSGFDPVPNGPPVRFGPPGPGVM